MSNDAPNRRIEFIAYDFEHSEETVERGVPPSALVRRSDVALQPHSSFEVRADNLDLGGSRGSRGGYPLAALGSEDWCSGSQICSHYTTSANGLSSDECAPQEI